MEKIYEHYNWPEIDKQYTNYKKWAKEWLSKRTNADKAIFKEENPAPSYLKPQLSGYELKLMDMALADIPLIRDDNGLVSPLETLKNISGNEDKKALVHYLASLTSRSDLYAGSSKDYVRYCALVPLFLAAHKEYNGVNYEEWNKSDKYMWLATGEKLDSEIKKWLDIPLAPSALKVARKNALVNKSGKAIPPSQWPYHTIEIGGVKASAASLARHILLQTWLANVEFRHEFMILDLHNWDHIPPALDAVVKKPTGSVITAEWKEELPW